MKEKKLKNQLNTLHDHNDYLLSKSFDHHSLKIEILFYKAITEMDSFNNYYFYKINESNYQYLHQTFPGVFSKISDYSLINLNYTLSKGSIILVINDVELYEIQLSRISNIAKEQSHIDPVNVFETNNDFSESLNDNLALVTKRLKTNKLKIDHFELGSMSKNDCYVLYLDSYAKKSYTKKILKRLEKARNLHDNYYSINDIAKLFNNNSLVPLSFYTSSPNTVVSNILKGRVVIMLDNTSVSCVLPASLSTFTSTKNELNCPEYYTFTNKLFICIFFFLSVFALSAFISIMNFHTSLLSPVLIANLQLTERGTSFPIFIEILIILFLYDFYRFATSRTPQNYIQNIVIFFGGLVIGQNAVEAGITGSFIIMLTSICYLSSFAITTNPLLITSLNIFRIMILLFSYVLGLVGFIFGTILIIIYLSNEKSVGLSFFDPFTPVNFKNIFNFFIPKKKGTAVDI